MQCCAGGKQSLRNIMVLGKKTVLQGEIVCVGWMAKLQFTTSGNLMFQTELRYKFISKILNEG